MYFIAPFGSTRFSTDTIVEYHVYFADLTLMDLAIDAVLNFSLFYVYAFSLAYTAR